MKRDMDLARSILLKIEEEYVSTALEDLSIEGYDMESVAYHCKLLNEAGFVSSYKGFYADDELWMFSVGPLTWEGHEFLDRIRDDSIWSKTKEAIRNNGLPVVLETIKNIAYGFVTAMSEGATAAVISSIQQGR